MTAAAPPPFVRAEQDPPAPVENRKAAASDVTDAAPERRATVAPDRPIVPTAADTLAPISDPAPARSAADVTPASAQTIADTTRATVAEAAIPLATVLSNRPDRPTRAARTTPVVGATAPEPGAPFVDVSPSPATPTPPPSRAPTIAPAPTARINASAPADTIDSLPTLTPSAGLAPIASPPMAVSSPVAIAAPAPADIAPEPRRQAGAAAEVVPVRIAPQPSEAPPLVAGTTAPAFRLFAAAIHAARTDEHESAPTPAAPTALVTPVHATPSVGDAKGATLDMADQRWPHAMVERIESLREAASAAKDAASTSIRLVPDALGTIDVRVRTEGDTVHVHFSAEQAATRTLLADAQPRLAEIAEARGLKLAGGDVGSGGQERRQPAQATPVPATPASAARDDDFDTATTTRIA